MFGNLFRNRHKQELRKVNESVLKCLNDDVKALESKTDVIKDELNDIKIKQAKIDADYTVMHTEQKAIRKKTHDHAGHIHNHEGKLSTHEKMLDKLVSAMDTLNGIVDKNTKAYISIKVAAWTIALVGTTFAGFMAFILGEVLKLW